MGIGSPDDSLEALLQNGPDYIQNGIVTFCDQVEIQEYVTDDTDPSESRSDMGGIDIGDQLSEGVCSMRGDAPCQFDRWCAKLHIVQLLQSLLIMNMDCSGMRILTASSDVDYSFPHASSSFHFK